MVVTLLQNMAHKASDGGDTDTISCNYVVNDKQISAWDEMSVLAMGVYNAYMNLHNIFTTWVSAPSTLKAVCLKEAALKTQLTC